MYVINIKLFHWKVRILWRVKDNIFKCVNLFDCDKSTYHIKKESQSLDVLDNDPIPQCKHCPASQEDWTLKPMQSGMLGNKLKNI